MNENFNSAISNKSKAATRELAMKLNDKYINGSIGNVVMLPLSKLSIGKYQKDLNIERVKKIVEKFDIHRMRPIDVSFRDGEYWVFDGQHRANAYYLLGIMNIPAVVHEGLTYQDEAYLFARQQEDVGSVNANHKWNALVEAKDDETMDIVKLCKSWGFTVLAKNNRGNNIKCVKRLRDMYHEFGSTKLQTVLMTVRDSWNYMEHSVDDPILGGIAILMRSCDNLNFIRLKEILSTTTPALVLRDKEDKFVAVRGEAKRAAYQIGYLYNKNLKNAKARLDMQGLK